MEESKKIYVLYYNYYKAAGPQLLAAYTSIEGAKQAGLDLMNLEYKAAGEPLLTELDWEVLKYDAHQAYFDIPECGLEVGYSDGTLVIETLTLNASILGVLCMPENYLRG